MDFEGGRISSTKFNGSYKVRNLSEMVISFHVNDKSLH